MNDCRIYSNLNGTFPRLILVTIPSEPFFKCEVNSSVPIGGIGFKLLTILAKMLKFTYQIQFPPDGMHYGMEKENGSWSGIVGMLDSRKADLAVVDLTITPGRMKVIDFSHPYFFDYVFIFTKQLPPLRLTQFFSVLSIEVWSLSSLAFLLLFLVLKRANRQTDWNHLKKTNVSLTSYNFFNHYSAMLKQVTFRESNHLWGSLITYGTWWFFAFLITNIFCANMTSFLNVLMPAPNINNLGNLADSVKSGRMAIGVLAESMAFDLIKTFKDEETVLRDYVVNNPSKSAIGTFKAAGPLLANGDFALLSELIPAIFPLIRISNDTFHLGYVGRESKYGVAMQKGSCWRTSINKAILQVQAAGLFAKWETDLYYDSQAEALSSLIGSKRNKPRFSINFLPFTTIDLIVAWNILFSGYLVASFTLLMEFFWEKMHTKIHF